MAEGSKNRKSKKIFILLILIITFNGVAFSQWYGHPFSGYADFSDSTLRDSNFCKATFLNAADFSVSTFSNASYFINATFTKPARFGEVTFIQDANFSGATFKDSANFYNTTFSEDANFYGTRFSKYLDFSDASFSGDAYFVGDSIKDFANFSFDTIKGKLSFMSTCFSTHADLSWLKFGENAEINFFETTLPDMLDFSNNPKIPNEIDLTTANFKNIAHFDSTGKTPYKKHKIFLNKSDISKIHFDYEHFQLSFDKPHKYSKALADDDKESIYEACLKNFKDRGQNESYKALDIEYQGFKWKKSSIWWLGWLPRWWWNYGYDKELIFIRTPFLALIFSFLTFLLYNPLRRLVYEQDKIPAIPNGGSRNFAKKIYYSIIYTSILFFKLSIDVKNLKFTGENDTIKIKIQRMFLLFYIFIVYSAGLICLGYMANFVLQK